MATEDKRAEFMTPVAGESAADEKTYLFFHKAYRSFKVGPFQFKDSYLRVNAEEREEFYKLIKHPKFPRHEAIHIAEVNEEAAAAASVSVLDVRDSTVVRGATGAGDIKTAKDGQNAGAAANQSTTTSSAAGLNPNPQGPKPTFQLPGQPK